MIGELMAHLWQSTLFASVAGLLTLAFRKNRANVRFWLWLSASLKFFVPFALLMTFGSRLDWAPAAQRMVAQRLPVPQVSFAVERIAAPFPEPLQFAPAAHGAVNWTPFALLGFWACGFAGIAFIRLRSWRRVRAAVRASAPLRIPAAVEIRSSASILEPSVVGFLRPILLLPEGIVERLTPSQLEAVLAHELCHVRRRDNLFASIHMVVEALFWFHPLVWWIGARLVEERERACDECVLTTGSEPRIYADAILSVCKLYMESPLVCVSGVTGANLKRRIEAIMANRTGQGLNRAKKFLLAAAGIAALAGPVAIGIVIGVGNTPAIHAQPSSTSAPRALDVPQPTQPEVTQPNPAAAASAPAQALPVSSPPATYQDHRLLAMLFDLDTMTSGDQARARQSAAEFVRTRMAPADLVALMTVTGGEVKVLQDFIDDHGILESTLLKIDATEGNSPAAGIAHRLSTIETAAHILGGLTGRKALIYFASGVEQPGADDQAELRRAIDAAIKSNVAIYTIDSRGLIPQIMPQAGPAGAPAAPQPTVEAQGVVEGSAHIDWSPPLARYWSRRGADAALEDLPGGHFIVQVHAAGEYQEILVPISEYRGQVQISGQIKSLPNTPQAGAGFGRLVQALTGTYQASVILDAGSYVCSVLVTEVSTGKTYGETVAFEVK
jgi:beta-lactamase regulating signal transducer with metallopeptidase domain